MNELTKIQKELKAPKNQWNKFGNYSYRSAEDILEAVKPLIPDTCRLTISDDIVEVGGRVYVKAVASFVETGTLIEVSAYAREAETKKGMDDAQITGSASSYARKYALNGLFLIDDTKDADSTNKHGKESETTPPPAKPNMTQAILDKMIDKIKAGENDILKKCQQHYTLTGKQHDTILNAELDYSN